MHKLYILKEEGTLRFKIGITRNDIKSRIKGLQTGNSNEIIEYYHYESPYAIKIETALHNTYSIYNTKGEWFEMSFKEIDDLIKRIPQLESNFQYLNDNKI